MKHWNKQINKQQDKLNIASIPDSRGQTTPTFLYDKIDHITMKYLNNYL